MTNSSCVVVCAGGQARLFTLEPAELPELESGPNLVPLEELSSELVGEPSLSFSITALLAPPGLPLGRTTCSPAKNGRSARKALSSVML